jgi:hypothetical protein
MRGQLADDPLTEGVAAETSVAIGDLSLGRYDVGRVADDEVELLAGDRLEEVALPELDRRRLVQDCVERGEAQRARVDVDRGHMVGVGGGEQRLMPVAAAEVERALDRSADGQPGEHPGRRRRAEDMIGLCELLAERVAREQQVLRRRQLDRGSCHLADTPEKPHPLQPRQRQRVEGRDSFGCRHLDVEQEELDQGLEPAAVSKHVQVERKLRRVAPGPDLGREPVTHARRRVAGIEQHRPEEGDPLRIVDPRCVGNIPGLRHCERIVRHVPSPVMSGRARAGARIAATMLATAAVVLPPAAWGASAATVALSKVKIDAAWDQGWLTGSLQFTVSASGAGPVTASIRSASGHLVTASHYSFSAAGAKAETIKLPSRVPPGGYVLTAGDATSKFSVPNPPEGVIDTATISKTQGGKPVTSLPDTDEIWVRFHFLAKPPSATTVKVEWRTPSYTFVGAITKPVATTIDGFVKASVPLPKGTWYAIIEVNGKVAKQQDVKLT